MVYALESDQIFPVAVPLPPRVVFSLPCRRFSPSPAYKLAHFYRRLFKLSLFDSDKYVQGQPPPLPTLLKTSAVFQFQVGIFLLHPAVALCMYLFPKNGTFLLAPLYERLPKTSVPRDNPKKE